MNTIMQELLENAILVHTEAINNPTLDTDAKADKVWVPLTLIWQMEEYPKLFPLTSTLVLTLREYISSPTKHNEVALILVSEALLSLKEMIDTRSPVMDVTWQTHLETYVVHLKTIIRDLSIEEIPDSIKASYIEKIRNLQ